MCRYVGAGMHSFATREVFVFKNRKGSTMIGRARFTLPFTTIIERVSDSAPSSPWNLSAYWPWVATMPSKPVRKSTCQKARRNSPSVTACRPAASCIRTASRMQPSSIFLSCGDLSARAFFSAAGRKRLPTWSARKGGRMAQPTIVKCPPPCAWSDTVGRAARSHPAYEDPPRRPETEKLSEVHRRQGPSRGGSHRAAPGLGRGEEFLALDRRDAGERMARRIHLEDGQAKAHRQAVRRLPAQCRGRERGGRLFAARAARRDGIDPARMGRAGQDRVKSEIHRPQRSSSPRAAAPRSLARLFHHPAVGYRCDAPRPRRAVTPLVEGEGFVGSFHVADVARKNLQAVLLEQVGAQPHVVADASPRHDPVERNSPRPGFDQVDHSQGEHVVRHS